MEKHFFARAASDGFEVGGDPQAAFGSKICEAFAEWIWDGEHFVLENDRYGIYPVYFHHSPELFAVSSSISDLLKLAGDIEFDEDALALFLRLGWLVGEDTLFRSIKAVPPGSRLEWSYGEITLSSRGIFIPKPTVTGRSEAIGRYRELFTLAVKKTAPAAGRTAVPLSGGRDSRHILLELCCQGKRPDACLTTLHPPPRADEDARIAAMVCEAVGVPHSLVPQPKSRFRSEWQKNILTGYSAYEHGWFMGLSAFIEGKWENVYDGIAGDVLSAGLFLDEENLGLYREGKFEALAETVMEPEGYIGALLSKEQARRLSRERASARLQTELRRHAEAPNPVGSFYFWNRTRRCIALSPFRLLGNVRQVITPYIEPELYDFLASLPAEMFLDHNFHTDTISASYSEHSGIPYEKKRVGPAHDMKNYRSYANALLSKAMSPRNRSLSKRSFFVARFLAAQLMPRVDHSVVYYGEQATHLLQLERL